MGLHGLTKLLGKVAVLSDSQRFKRRYESKRTAWLQPDGEGELRRKSSGKTPEPSAVMEVYMKNTHTFWLQLLKLRFKALLMYCSSHSIHGSIFDLVDVIFGLVEATYLDFVYAQAVLILSSPSCVTNLGAAFPKIQESHPLFCVGCLHGWGAAPRLRGGLRAGWGCG